MYRIGIPRALFYYKFYPFFDQFFNNLNCTVVISPVTNKDILENGINLAMDESCLSMKIFMGHVNELATHVDYLLIPRMESVVKGEELCARFLALPDIVGNAFQNVKLLQPDIVAGKIFRQLAKSASKITRNYWKIITSYKKAKERTERERNKITEAKSYFEIFGILNDLDTAIPTGNQFNIALIGHSYNVYDQLIGFNVAKKLAEMGARVQTVEMIPMQEAVNASFLVSRKMPWSYNRAIVGATKLYIEKGIDGIVLLTTFPCGPDAFSNEIVFRKYNEHLPMLLLMIDELEGEAGLDTRLEVFIDMVKTRKESLHDEIGIVPTCR